MRYLVAWSIALLALLALSSSCSSGNEYRAACQRVWDAGLITEEAMIEEDGRILSESEFVDECERRFEELDPGERAIALVLLKDPEALVAFTELAEGLNEAFTEPPCTDLVDTQPVPAQFLDDDGELWGLDCELDGSNIYGFLSGRCEATGQNYYANDYGWVYKDDKIFHLGDVPENCSLWYEPPCTDLVDGQPVPAEFLDDDGEFSELACELDGSNTGSWFSDRCEATGRMYYANDYGWAYKDDRIFHLGDVPENCSPWYEPPCTDLVDGKLIPEDFLSKNGNLHELKCELNGSTTWGMISQWCEATGQMYYNNDYGWAYVDDKIFHLGHVPEDCSRW